MAKFRDKVDKSAAKSVSENAKVAKTKIKPKKKAVEFSPCLYHILIILTTIWRHFIHGKSIQTKAFKKQKRRGASLIIANHLTAFDFIYFVPTLTGRKTNMVVAESMMYSRPIFATLMTAYHIITKKQNFADFKCIKSIKRYLDAGISVVICPEGKVAAEGKTGLIPDSTGRLVQWLGYPVLTVVNKGSGLMRPKWAHNNRDLKVYSYCDQLFTADDTKKFSKAELNEKIRVALSHNEHEYQIENQIYVKGKSYAEGLERLLYHCPKCDSEFAIKSCGDTLTCSECGNSVRYLHTGEIVPTGNSDISLGRIDYWYDMQRGIVAAEIENADFKLSNAVDLFLENEDRNGYRFIKHGILTLDCHKIAFEITPQTSGLCIENEPSKFSDIPDYLEFNVGNLSTVANIPGDSLDLYDENHTYRFVFDGKKMSTKFTLAIEALSAKK